MKIIKCAQQTDEWFKLRKGKLTMSHAREILAKPSTSTHQTYIASVASEQVAPDWEAPGFSNRHTERGNELEPFALQAAEKALGLEFESVGFVLADDDRIGGSPDGLGVDCGIEIKCPEPKVHLKHLDRKYTEKEHGAQMYGNAWVCQKSVWHFVSFCPWVKDMPLIRHSFAMDDDMRERFDLACQNAANAVDLMVAETLERLPAKGVPEIATKAVEHWSLYNAEWIL